MLLIDCFILGKIHVILNKLHKLSKEQYDSVGTANMVIDVLCETLGVSRNRLATILTHLIYDGVYASPEERVSGGGCLDLKNNICKLLKIHSDNITGN